MKIVADENIPYVRDAFALLGDVVTMPGRAITRDHLLDADLLMVRSITKVNADLLEGTPVRFVATATIGEDHIDKPWLAAHDIGFASAPGSNAESVAQYISSALVELADALELDLSTMSLGIIGVGNVGKRVWRCAKGLGLRCVLHDPPLARSTGDPVYRPREEVEACDIITVHVPLTKEGDEATYHLVDGAFISRLKPGAIVFNSSRGKVADGDAIKAALASGHLRACVLDVWEQEPVVDPELLEQVFIGTPHIAGYSFDGKVKGTQMIYEAACAFLGVPATWDPAPLLPAPECPHVDIATDDPWEGLLHAVRSVYRIREVDDANMRTLLTTPESERSAAFDRLRKQYPRRREFANTTVSLKTANPALETRLSALGFQVR